VPWCAPCDRFLSPSTVLADGTCPSCGRVVDPGRARRATAVNPAPAPASGPVEEPAVPVPWHLKLLLVALAIYLAYRAYQGVAWVVSLL
jgi:hypothetical protein